jgi:hypothetical protein
MGAHFSTYNIRITQALSFVKPKLSESGYPGFKDFQDKEENNYIGVGKVYIYGRTLFHS